jgi:hypothetical protein
MPLAERVVILAALMAAAAACATSDDDTTTQKARSVETRAQVPGETNAAGECLPRESTVARNAPARPDTVLLVDAQVSKEGCTDVVTLEFVASGTQLPPGYRAEYVPGPFRDFTSGDEIFQPDGVQAYLAVRFSRTVVVFGGPAPDVDDPDPFPPYMGRESIDPSGMNHLHEARLVQGSEGKVQWVIRLDSKRPFLVDATSEPPRVIVRIG